MKQIFLTGLLATTASFLWAQQPESLLTVKEAARIENVLASDGLRGRKAFSPEIDKAADFIAAEFKAAGLTAPEGGYKQGFVMVQPKLISASASFDGVAVDQKNIMVVTCQAELQVNEHSGYEVTPVKPGENLRRIAAGLVQENKNRLVLVDESYATDFSRLAFLKRSLFKKPTSVIFLLTNKAPSAFTIEARHEIKEQGLTNVVGLLPGKSKKNEYVIFSGHYDHLGIGKPESGDSIYNGANDDAAGTTAVIMLASYFKRLGNNERTLVFAAFTAEEVGGFGSQYFSRQFDPASVAAMFNIEMIGTESKWGTNSAYITGFEKTDMGTILQRNLEGSGFTFYPDPYTDQQLFYRSDNATLARQGVPAHTISTSKMDTEPNYHKVSDEVSTLDLENMARIIRAIAISSKSIIAGKDTPARVKVEELL